MYTRYLRQMLAMAIIALVTLSVVGCGPKDKFVVQPPFAVVTITPTPTNTPTPTPTPTPTRTPTPTATPTPIPEVEAFFIFAPQGCPDCEKQAPIIESFHKAAPPGVTVLGVPSDPSTVTDFMKRHGITFRIIIDPSLANTYLGNYPAIVFKRKPEALYVPVSKGISIIDTQLKSQYNNFAQGKTIIVITRGKGGSP